MGFFTKKRDDGATFDGQGQERVGFIDNVFYNLEEDVLLARHPYDNLYQRPRDGAGRSGDGLLSGG